MSLTIPETIRLLLPDGTVERVALEAYVRGVVAATLTADTPLEALKAQAVAARTFGAITRRHIERGAEVCTRRHCQVWTESSSRAIARAVTETRGLVATFNGRLIEAFYFEHCDGHTRDAAGVLMPAPAYLRAVACPCGFATLKGHGIGMCQRGAVVMARFGDSFDQILKHYYNGITLERAQVAHAPLEHAPEVKTTKRLRPVELAPRKVLEPNEVKKDKPAARPTPSKKSVKAEPPAESSATRLRPKRTLTEPPAATKPTAPPKIEPPPQAEPTPAFADIARNAPETPAPQSVTPPTESTPVVSDTSSWYPTAEEVATIDALPEVEKSEDNLIASRMESPPFVAPTAPPTVPESMPEPLRVFIVEPPGKEIEASLRPALTPEPPPPPAREPRAIQREALPPLEEAAEPRPLQKVIIDHLPGPRVIAGNLIKPGIIVTLRDEEGHSVVTVSGVAKHYGAGGFEAPLSHDGAYAITFDHEAVEVKLENETVFIHYAE